MAWVAATAVRGVTVTSTASGHLRTAVTDSTSGTAAFTWATTAAGSTVISGVPVGTSTAARTRSARLPDTPVTTTCLRPSTEVQRTT